MPVQTSMKDADIAGVGTRSAAGSDLQSVAPDFDEDHPARQLRELSSVAGRVHETYPDIPAEAIRSLVEEAHAELADSRIQSFRLILTERAVRRRLGPNPNM